MRGLRVARTRRGFRSQPLRCYQRRQGAVNELIGEAFLRGVSTRQVGQVREPILGEDYSASTISRITRQLDAAVQAFPRRALRDEHVYLFLDGVVLKVRGAGGKVRRRVVLAVCGVRRDGVREVVGYRLARGERAEG